MCIKRRIETKEVRPSLHKGPAQKYTKPFKHMILVFSKNKRQKLVKGRNK